MPTLPLNVTMQGKRVTIIGGGAVALRKLRTLLPTGAFIRLVAPDIHPGIAELENSGHLSLHLKMYHVSDLDQAFLVIAATDNPEVNRKIAADAREQRVLVAVTDNPSVGDCTFPAILRRGELEIAVSTGGRSPTLAADVRDEIAGIIGDEYGAVLEQLAAEREKLLTDGHHGTYNTEVLRSLARKILAGLTERKETLP